MKPLAFYYCIACFSILIAGNSFGQSTQLPESSQKKWWKEAIVYQIYPRSFKDSDGDGIGDLKGILSKLDYIKSLGVDVVWLNPVYSSPNDDNGYDVSDYRNIMKDFGTMEDFDALLEGMHQRGIKLVMDLVVNHSSDEHEWFKQSRSSRNSPYRSYYHWWPAEKGKPPYRYSLFDINHDAWLYDSLTNAYYLHYFSRKQPDLKWESATLRKEIYDIMHFWAKKGIDGFRLDAFQFAAKDSTYPKFPPGFEKNFVQYYAMQGNLHGYLQEMYKEVLSKYDVMSVAEGAGNNFEDAHNLVDADRKELNMAYAFEGVDIATAKGYTLSHFKNVFSKWDSAFASNGWLSVFLANHDQARLVSRFGNDKPAYRSVSSKMLNTFILTMRGTPYCYNGDELGMTNADFKSIDEFKDVATLNEYKRIQKEKGDLKQYLSLASATSRDNGRTPYQWDSSPNAGFSNAMPWIKVAPNYKTINAADQENDENSCLNYFRALTKLRKEYADVLVYGSYHIVDKNNSSVYAYIRESGNQKILIVLNFSAGNASISIPRNLQSVKVLLSNYKDAQPLMKKTSPLILKPYQAIIFSL